MAPRSREMIPDGTDMVGVCPGRKPTIHARLLMGLPLWALDEALLLLDMLTVGFSTYSSNLSFLEELILIKFWASEVSVWFSCRCAGKRGVWEERIRSSHKNSRLVIRIVICCLEGARIGIQYETSFAGEPCEIYHCVLESKSFLEKMTVLEHTVPFFLPIREAENDLLSSNAMKFIDYVGELLQAYVDRREQVRLIKELYENQIGELYHSLPYHVIEFVLDDSDCKVTVSLRYADLVSVLPTRIRVLAWPVHPSKKSSMTTPINRKGNGMLGAAHFVDIFFWVLIFVSLPYLAAYAEIVLNLPRALQQIFQHSGPT
ncbi:hypothetical protein HHK36_021112 [Tetracentron sinense]|uniref:Centromere protein O n=1 Tax=Tetracentron sinense TaxID=13715 RepID=A0A834YUH7_TETSI|nr:hypothetical protein HHK36_021112 [Tetracentron sinense]